MDRSPAHCLRRIEYIQEYYQSTDEKAQNAYNRPYIYLSRAEMDSFVDETTAQPIRIYNQVWMDAVQTDGFDSALDLKP